jgi:hypothetical protein
MLETLVQYAALIDAGLLLFSISCASFIAYSLGSSVQRIQSSIDKISISIQDIDTMYKLKGTFDGTLRDSNNDTPPLVFAGECVLSKVS